jgi:hypothetical protein
MSNQALDLLIEHQLIKPNGKPIEIEKLPKSEISARYFGYKNARKDILLAEIEQHERSDKLNAQYSTWSAKPSQERVLSSLLVYNKVTIDDPLISERNSIRIKDLVDALNFFSWLHPLIRANLVTVFPITFYNNPSNHIPLLHSEDAFKSSIPENLHDFFHQRAVLKSVIPNDRGEMLILREDAAEARRPAINVGFCDDILYSGVSLFRFETIEGYTENSDGSLSVRKKWDPQEQLSEEKFQAWSYQAINQAIMARLKTINDQSCLAQHLGNTYITESPFESNLLNLSLTKNSEKMSPAVNFLTINDTFFRIDSPESIIEIREKHAYAFDRFNSSLLSISDELNGISQEEFEIKSATLFNREILPQINDCRSAAKQVQRDMAKGALVSLGSIALGVATGSMTPALPAFLYSISSSLTEGLTALGNYQDQKKKPSYIWHRIASKKL